MKYIEMLQLYIFIYIMYMFYQIIETYFTATKIILFFIQDFKIFGCTIKACVKVHHMFLNKCIYIYIYSKYIHIFKLKYGIPRGGRLNKK